MFQITNESQLGVNDPIENVKLKVEKYPGLSENERNLIRKLKHRHKSVKR
jgi:hypothetical protein